MSRAATAMKKAAAPLTCPECGTAHPSPAALGRHRRFVHGVKGIHAQKATKPKPKRGPGKKTPPPSLAEAIATLRLEMSVLRDVLAKLEAMNGGRQ